MAIRIPSNASAALAGVWLALSVAPFLEFLLTHAPSNKRRLVEVAWVLLFLVLPFQYFVVGAIRRDPSLTLLERIRRGRLDLPPGGGLRAVCWAVALASTLAAVRVFFTLFHPFHGQLGALRVPS